MNKLRLISLYEGYGNFELYDANSDVYAITDNFVMDERYKGIPSDKKVALMVEPRSFIPKAYEYLETHYNEFKYIFTFDDKLLTLPNAKIMPYGTYWCTSDEEKTKGVSMICSDKAFLEGHKKDKRLLENYTMRN